MCGTSEMIRESNNKTGKMKEKMEKMEKKEETEKVDDSEME
jgi:hypothetical protein